MPRQKLQSRVHHLSPQTSRSGQVTVAVFPHSGSQTRSEDSAKQEWGPNTRKRGPVLALVLISLAHSSPCPLGGHQEPGVETTMGAKANQVLVLGRLTGCWWKQMHSGEHRQAPDIPNCVGEGEAGVWGWGRLGGGGGGLQSAVGRKGGSGGRTAECFPTIHSFQKH